MGDASAKDPQGQLKELEDAQSPARWVGAMLRPADKGEFRGELGADFTCLGTAASVFEPPNISET